MAADKLGIDGQLNMQTDGVSGAAGWGEVVDVIDLEQSLDKNQIENTTRANNGWKSSKGGLKSGDLSFNVPWLSGNTHFQALVNAWLNGTHLGFQVFDGPVNPSGLIADFEVISVKLGQPRDGVQTADVSLSVTSIDTAPAWQDPT